MDCLDFTVYLNMSYTESLLSFPVYWFSMGDNSGVKVLVCMVVYTSVYCVYYTTIQ